MVVKYKTKGLLSSQNKNIYIIYQTFAQREICVKSDIYSDKKKMFKYFYYFLLEHDNISTSFKTDLCFSFAFHEVIHYTCFHFLNKFFMFYFYVVDSCCFYLL